MDIQTSDFNAIIKKPIDVVNKLFIEALHSNSSILNLPEKEVFNQLLQNPLFVEKVPLLNSAIPGTIPSGTLVKFRGLVQDMFDVEYSFCALSVVSSETNENRLINAKYSDCVPSLESNLQVDWSNKANVQCEKQPFFVVSVPGESEWITKTQVTDLPVLSSRGIAKRTRDSEPSETIASSPGNSTTRDSEPAKKMKSDLVSSDSSPFVSFLNYPTENPNNRCCIVKVYEHDADLKLNEIVDFYGILSTDSSLNCSKDDQVDSEFLDDYLAHHPPFELIPRLHVLTYQKCPSFHPIEKDFFGNEQRDQIFADLTYNVQHQLREHLLQHFRSLLVGDSLAAEYCLLFCLAKIIKRSFDGLCVGDFSMNFAGLPIGDGIVHLPSILHQSISRILPMSLFLPLSLSSLHSHKFSPYKDYDSNRLIAGCLQLANGTRILIDETALEEGQLNENGVRNVQAIQHLLNTNQVMYDFHYHQTPWNVDFPTLIFSEGKSMFQAKATLFVEPSEVEKQSLDTNVVSSLQQYCLLCLTMDYCVPDHISEAISADFANMRQSCSTLTPDLFSWWLTLARLESLSLGEQTLSTQTWSKVKGMEEERMSRLNKHCFS